MDAMRPSAVFEIPTGESKSLTGMEIAEELVDKSDRNVMPPSAYLCHRLLIQCRPSDARPKHTKGSGSPGNPSNPSYDTSAHWPAPLPQGSLVAAWGWQALGLEEAEAPGISSDTALEGSRAR
jgi:hypothetical protein